MFQHLADSRSQRDEKDFRSGTNSTQEQGFSWSLPKYNTYKHNVFHKGRHWAKYLSQQWPIVAMWKEKGGTWKESPTVLSQLPATNVSRFSEPRDSICTLIFIGFVRSVLPKLVSLWTHFQFWPPQHPVAMGSQFNYALCEKVLPLLVLNLLPVHLTGNFLIFVLGILNTHSIFPLIIS